MGQGSSELYRGPFPLLRKGVWNLSVQIRIRFPIRGRLIQILSRLLGLRFRILSRPILRIGLQFRNCSFLRLGDEPGYAFKQNV